MRYLLISLGYTVVMSAGQIILKLGMKDRRISTIGDLLSSFFTPLILFGIGVYVVATFVLVVRA